MRKILIIDDDPIYSDMLRERLLREGYDVTVHLGPFGGTAAAAQPDLDLIILDVFMPGLDGPDLLALIRKRRIAKQASAKVMFMSSMDAEPLRELAIRNQADGSLPKSARRAEVLEYVAAMLQPHDPRDVEQRK
ncbi:MAG TPA: response regulator [Polyangiaceae bacterium]|jgi:two-component system copper resistance phosphate regulon response regulator CusR|nr:response regulator [Polyangiaceae bacterium]